MAQDAGSRSFWSTQVSYSPTAQGGGLCRQLNKGTLGSDPVPAAGSVGTPSPPSLPSPPPRLPERPWLRAPLSRAAPSHDTSGMAHAPDAPTEAAETYGVCGSPARGCTAAAASPSRRGAQPWQLPRAWPDSGFSLGKAPPRVLACLPQRRSVRRRPLPHIGERSVNRPGWWGTLGGMGRRAPSPATGIRAASAFPRTGHPTMAPALSHPPAIPSGSPGPPGSIRPPKGSHRAPAPQVPVQTYHLGGTRKHRVPSRELTQSHSVFSPPFIFQPLC